MKSLETCKVQNRMCKTVFSSDGNIQQEQHKNIDLNKRQLKIFQNDPFFKHRLAAAILPLYLFGCNLNLCDYSNQRTTTLSVLSVGDNNITAALSENSVLAFRDTIEPVYSDGERVSGYRLKDI